MDDKLLDKTLDEFGRGMPKVLLVATVGLAGAAILGPFWAAAGVVGYTGWSLASRRARKALESEELPVENLNDRK